MKKKLCAILVLILFVMTITANAVQPRVINPTLSLSFSGTTANCSGLLSSVGDKIDVELQLWQGNKMIASWPASGTSAVSASGTCSVTKGKTYSLLFAGTIDGATFSSQPLTKAC